MFSQWCCELRNQRQKKNKKQIGPFCDAADQHAFALAAVHIIAHWPRVAFRVGDRGALYVWHRYLHSTHTAPKPIRRSKSPTCVKSCGFITANTQQRHLGGERGEDEGGQGREIKEEKAGGFFICLKWDWGQRVAGALFLGWDWELKRRLGGMEKISMTKQAAADVPVTHYEGMKTTQTQPSANCWESISKCKLGCIFAWTEKAQIWFISNNQNSLPSYFWHILWYFNV